MKKKTNNDFLGVSSALENAVKNKPSIVLTILCRALDYTRKRDKVKYQQLLDLAHTNGYEVKFEGKHRLVKKDL